MNLQRQPGRGGSAGFTLVELVIVVVILAMMLGSMLLVSRTSEMAFDRGTATTDLELRAGAVTATLVAELEAAVEETLVIGAASPVGASSMEYRSMQDIEAGLVTLSERRILRLELEAGETDNGTDDDGDGLVDEGQLVLVKHPGSPEEDVQVIVRGVRELLVGEAANGLDDNGNGLIDEPGFVIVRDGTLLDIHLSLVRALSDQAGVASRTVRKTLNLRN